MLYSIAFTILARLLQIHSCASRSLSPLTPSSLLLCSTPSDTHHQPSYQLAIYHSPLSFMLFLLSNSVFIIMSFYRRMPAQPLAPRNEPNIMPQVIEYLVKKGYNKTEQMLRQESSHLDKEGKPIHERAEDLGTAKYSKGFRLLSNWIDQNLDIYKVNPNSNQTSTHSLTRSSTNFGAYYGRSSSIRTLASSWTGFPKTVRFSYVSLARSLRTSTRTNSAFSAQSSNLPKPEKIQLQGYTWTTNIAFL